MKTFIEKLKEKTIKAKVYYDNESGQRYRLMDVISIDDAIEIMKEAYNKGISDSLEKARGFNVLYEEEKFAKLDIIESIKSLEIK